ncbi:MAG: DNA polymerase III subunit beta [Bacilli bacterium]
MKIALNKETLSHSISIVAKAVASRPAMPILAGIKIEVTDNGILLTGSDSDISIQSLIPLVDENGTDVVQVQQRGSIVIQAKVLVELIRKLPDSTVTIFVNEQFQSKITSGKSEFNLIGYDPDDYPNLQTATLDHHFTMSASTLKSMIRQTVFAVATQETRPALTGVNWKTTDNEFLFVATDSHRLALRKLPFVQHGEKIDHAVTISNNFEPINIVIPGRSLNELSKILDDKNSMVYITVQNHQVIFRSDKTVFITRLVEGSFPDTSRLIPNESKTDVIVKTRAMLDAIDRASLLAKEGKNNVVKFTSLNDANVQISSNSPEIGKVMEEISVESYEGEELKISFSAKYMLDALKAIEDESVKISFTGAMRPFIIRPSQKEQTKILQLILPVRTY